jgi:hypothetical protein
MSLSLTLEYIMDRRKFDITWISKNEFLVLSFLHYYYKMRAMISKLIFQ